MDPFVAEIRIFAFNFAPAGWAFCDGQILPISQNTALFSLLGTTYGGDGKSNFALPNLQGMAPLHFGQGPGLSLRDLGEAAGSANVTLLTSQIPAHTHAAKAYSATGDDYGPAGDVWAPDAGGASQYAAAPTANKFAAPDAFGVVGSSFPHNNLQPYLTLNFCIALQGVYPARS